MTISTEYSPINYTGNGVTVDFAFPYVFYNSSDLIVTSTVISTGVATVQVLDTNYTVSGGSGSTGTVTFISGAPASTVRITIELDIPPLQLQDYVENGAFPAETLERGFDKVTLLAQQSLSKANRALVVPSSDVNPSLTLPDQTARAGKALYFDASGNPAVTSASDTASAAAAALAAAAAAASATAASGYATTAQNAVAGLKWKNSVRAATTANITLSGPQTIDGVAVIAGNRVLVKDQSTASQNGIYLCAAGAWTRDTDADAWTELVSATTNVEEGTTNADKTYVCTVNTGGTLNTTAVTWALIAATPTIASQAEAEAGSNNTNMMTSLRVAQAIDAQVPLFKSFTSTAQTITAAGALVIPHGLAAVPKLVTAELTCTTNDAGYTAGQIVEYHGGIGTQGNSAASSSSGIAIIKDATNVTIRFGSSASPATIYLLHATTGALTGLINSSWTVTFKVYA